MSLDRIILLSRTSLLARTIILVRKILTLFSPVNIPDLAWWFAADKETIYSNNDPVPTITDQNGSSDFIQAVGTRQHTYKTGIFNGLAVYDNDGGDDNCNSDVIIDTGAATTYAFVVKLDAIAVNRGIYCEADTDSTGDYILFRINGTGNFEVLARSAFGASDVLDFGAANPTTTPIAVTIEIEANKDVSVYLNGSQLGITQAMTNFPTSAIDTACVGALILGGTPSQNWLGEICEGFRIDNTITTRQRSQIFNYLSRWS